MTPSEQKVLTEAVRWYKRMKDESCEDINKYWDDLDYAETRLLKAVERLLKTKEG